MFVMMTEQLGCSKTFVRLLVGSKQIRGKKDERRNDEENIIMKGEQYMLYS
jgi:hypothetical protein